MVHLALHSVPVTPPSLFGASTLPCRSYLCSRRPDRCTGRRRLDTLPTSLVDTSVCGSVPLGKLLLLLQCTCRSPMQAVALMPIACGSYMFLLHVPAASMLSCRGLVRQRQRSQHRWHRCTVQCFKRSCDGLCSCRVASGRCRHMASMCLTKQVVREMWKHSVFMCSACLNRTDQV